MPTIADLFSSPDHYLMAFDRDQALFAAMNRAAYHRSVFLDGRIARVAAQQIAAPVDAVCAYRAKTRTPRLRTGWIFHVAHCGSTLLARALDRTDAALVLREPVTLRQIAVAATGSARPRAWHDLFELTVCLAGRRYAPAIPTIVKANVPVNFIVGDIMAADPAAPAVFLYYPFEPYLLAILRSPNHRNWVQSVTTELREQLAPLVGDIGGLDVAERAAALWLAQMIVYAGAIEIWPNAYGLDAETLFGMPHTVIAAASALFGSPMTTAQINACVASDLFATYSKDPARAFDNTARLARQTEQARVMRADLTRGRQWLNASPARARLPLVLDRPLVGQAPRLL